MIYQYFFEVSIVWLIFLIIYKFLLGYETFFQKNRVYLISAVMIGLLLPLVRLLPFSFQTDILPVTGLYILEDGLSITGLNNVVSDNPGINWSVIILMFYLAGVLLGVSRLIYGLNKIYKLRSEALVVSKNGYTLVVTNTFHLPFSFFKMVFVNRDMLEHKAIKEILKHEMTHVKHAHSFDVFFLELVTIFFWWNPLIYLYKHAIKETHEFLADQLACDTGSKAGYSRLLLSQDESSVQLALTHQFFQSHLKNRIKMLDKSNSSNFRLFKYLIVIPVALLMIIIFSASSDFHDHHSIPEELIVKLDKSMDQNLFDNGINPTGETNVVQLYSSLKKEFPKYSSYIETQLVRKAKEYGYDLGFDHHENGKYCISQSRTEISFPERIHSIVKADSIPEKGRAELFKVVEQMPRFIGCDYGDMSNEEAVQCSNQKLIEYVGEHLVYPENAKKEGLEGMVVIRFSVLKTGKVDDVNILRDIGKGCGEAGASVIRNMNDDGVKWIPGQQRGKKVNVQYTLPIKFKLPKVPPAPEAPPAAPAPPKPPSVNEGSLKSKRTAAPQ
ncbi:MAG: M56 family metallopeptidase, partial [Bacteroidia bacterium]|nr:M56 family metallopeptidase [Bacteroidia bacterium]